VIELNVERSQVGTRSDPGIGGSAPARAHKISCRVIDAHATLKGAADSSSDRDRVVTAAWGMPEVRNLVDHTTQAY
jgi:osmotically-inducible protein OsmY